MYHVSRWWKLPNCPRATVTSAGPIAPSAYGSIVATLTRLESCRLCFYLGNEKTHLSALGSGYVGAMPHNWATGRHRIATNNESRIQTVCTMFPLALIFVLVYWLHALANLCSWYLCPAVEFLVSTPAGQGDYNL